MQYKALSFLPSPPAPPLPHFGTLLIQGDYPPSSPLHLCLSHLSCSNHPQLKSKPVLVTARNRSTFIDTLVEFNDGHLIPNAGLGTAADLLSQIRVFYPDTPDHWAFLFSVLSTTSVHNDPDTMSPNPDIHLDSPVSLVVLHELSAYFLDNDLSQSFTVYSYLRLITSALAALRTLNTGSNLPSLVVFDSRLRELTLPILPVTLANPIIGEGSEELGPGRRYTKVAPAVEKYFDWVGRVEIVAQPSITPETGDSNAYRMHFSPSEYSSHSSPNLLIWQWRTVRLKHSSNLPSTVFQCEDAI